MKLSTINKGFLYSDIVIFALCIGNSAYNNFKFYSVPQVNEAAMSDGGFRNYKSREDLVKLVSDPDQKVESQRYLDELNKSNAILAISGLAALGAGAGLSVCRKHGC